MNRLTSLLSALLVAGCSGATEAPVDRPVQRGDIATADHAEVSPAHDAEVAPDAGCSGITPPPRSLRLLNRWEYDRSVRDLLGLGGGSIAQACAVDTDCSAAVQSCTGGVCVADPCGLHTFVLSAAPGQYQSVHVAGSFNDWAPTVEQGGLAMTWHAAANVWLAKTPLDNGTHHYKLVADGTWLTDPNNPSTAPDGFGGQNSVVQQSCQADPAPALTSLAAGFPVESRPDRYPFDNHAPTAVVTSVHAEMYLTAARTIAASVDPLSLLGCAEPAACADALLDTVAAKAFRRPLTEAERARYRARILAEPDLAGGLRIALRVLLSSPYFLYRFELGEPDGDHFRLTPWETASALSYFLLGSAPDEALRQAAASGQLTTAAQREAQARRLLSHPHAREVVRRFAVQWLGVGSLLSADKHAGRFPGHTPEVAEALLEETRGFVEHVVFDGTGRFQDLLTADYTVASPALSELYEVPIPHAGAIIDAPPWRGAGVLSQGAVLATYAHSDQSSPIRRGLFVRRRILCQDLPDPPPNAGGVPEVDASATTRERFQQHSDDDFCRTCHQYIDSVGFGFERFDPVGAYRLVENGGAIDPGGDMNDVEGLGTATSAPFDTLAELGTTLAGSKQAPRCFATQAFRFASGRLEDAADRCTVDAIVERWAQSHYDVEELLVAIVGSPHFVLRRAP